MSTLTETRIINLTARMAQARADLDTHRDVLHKAGSVDHKELADSLLKVLEFHEMADKLGDVAVSMPLELVLLMWNRLNALLPSPEKAEATKTIMSQLGKDTNLGIIMDTIEQVLPGKTP